MTLYNRASAIARQIVAPRTAARIFISYRRQDELRIQYRRLHRSRRIDLEGNPDFLQFSLHLNQQALSIRDTCTTVFESWRDGPGSAYS